MDADMIAGTAGLVLSLAFSYIPGASGWYGALDATRKRLVMLGLLALSCVVLLALACTVPEFAGGVTCDKAGGLALVRAFFAALVVNQAAFLLSPRPAPRGPFFPKIGNMAGNKYEPDQYGNY